MYNNYNTPHQWRCGTPIEQYESDLINKYFLENNIFNPTTDLIKSLRDLRLGEEESTEE